VQRADEGLNYVFELCGGDFCRGRVNRAGESGGVYVIRIFDDGEFGIDKLEGVFVERDFSGCGNDFSGFEFF